MDTQRTVSRGGLGAVHRGRGWKPSLTAWFAILSISVCLLVTVLVSVDLMHARSVAVGVARREAENVSRSMTQQASDTFDVADGALGTLAQRVEHKGMQPAQVTGLRDTMVALGATFPQIHRLIVVDEHGRFVVSNSTAPGARMPSLTGRPFFRYHRAHRSSAVLISWPAMRNADLDGTLVATRRLDRADGSFAGVAVAQISLSSLAQRFAGVDVGRSGTIALVADDGTLVLRRPRAFIGADVHAARMFSDEYKTFTAASYIGVSPLDGVRRLSAFERLRRYPLTIVAGLAEKEYLAAWRADALANYLALAFGTALIGGLASGLGAQMTRRKRAENALAISSTDALTGLANRRRFDAELEREFARAAQNQTPLGLLMIEVGNLKAFNDRIGREKGDELLVTIARGILSTISPSSLAARYSGLEFAVILPATDETAALLAAEDIRRTIEGFAAAYTGPPRSMVTLALGAAGLVPETSAEPSAIVGAALVALHRAKHASQADTPELLPLDALTGFANRRRFDAELEREWRRAAENRSPVGLLVVEVENLKAFNDRHGREEGDELLVSIARTIAANIVLPDQLAARYSGLEFALILPATDRAGVSIVAERMRCAVRALAQPTGSHVAAVTVSIGTASLIPENSDEALMLVGAAFIALHDGKRQGRGDARDTRAGVKILS